EAVTIQVNKHDALTTQSDENGQVSTIVKQEESSIETLNVQAIAPDLGLVSSVVTIGGSGWFVVTDRQGADDINSSQVDLNLMGTLNNSNNVKKFVAAWDSTTDWTGTGQTGDICILYDTNNNGKIDFAICVRVNNFNANPNDVKIV